VRLIDRRGKIVHRGNGSLKNGVSELAPGEEAPFDVMVTDVRKPYIEKIEVDVLHD